MGWQRDWGKRKENLSFKDLFEARISTVVARTLEQKVKNMSSTGRDVVSGNIIFLPVVSERRHRSGWRYEKRSDK